MKLLFVAAAVLLLCAASVHSLETESSVDIDAEIANLAGVEDTNTMLATLQAEAEKAKSTNGVQRLVRMMQKVLRRLRRAMKHAAKRSKQARKVCRTTIRSSKARIAKAKGAIRTLQTRLGIAKDTSVRALNRAQAFSKKIADAAANGATFDNRLRSNAADRASRIAAWRNANDETRALVKVLRAIDSKLRSSGLVEVGSELTSAAATVHSDSETSTMLLAMAAKATAGGSVSDLHDMIQLLINTLLGQVSDNEKAETAFVSASEQGRRAIVASSDAARRNVKSLIAQRDSATLEGDKAKKSTLEWQKQLAAKQATLAAQKKVIKATRARCSAARKASVSKRSRDLKQVRVLKAIIKMLRNTKMSASIIGKIAGVKLNLPVWQKGSWSACSKQCGLGKKTRTVKCSGKKCKGDKPRTSAACTVAQCKENCVVSSWTRYSKCSKGIQTKTRKILARASAGGKACPSTAGLKKTRACKVKKAAKKGKGANKAMVRKYARKTARLAKAVRRNARKMRRAAKAVARLANKLKNAPTKAAFLQIKTKLIAKAKRLAALKKKDGKLNTNRFVSAMRGWSFTRAGRQARKLCRRNRLRGNAFRSCMQDIQLSGDKKAAIAAGRVAKKTAKVNVQTTAQNCLVSTWSAWGRCSTRCGAGVMSRTRTVVRPAKFGGKACKGLTQSKKCNMHACPVDCEMSAWTAWTSCSKSCGGGSQTQTRKIARNAANGGRGCPTSTKQTRACNTHRCPAPPAPPMRVQDPDTRCTKNSCPRPPTIPRNTQNAPTRSCWSGGDPHQLSFNGDYFHMQLPQIVTMAKTDDGLFEVQVYQDGSTGPGVPSWVREVKIRYGNQIFNENFNRDGFRVTGHGQVTISVPGAYQNKMVGACGGNQVTQSASNFKDQNGKLVNVHWQRNQWWWGIFGYGGGNTGVSKFEKAWKPTMDDCLFSAARCASNLRSNEQSGVMGRICTPWGCVDMRNYQ